MRYWNYRVLKHHDREEAYYAIHEVYYQDGKPDMHTADAITPRGESFEDLKADYEMLAEAFEKPALDVKTYKEV